ncbi:hypothetical protein OOJ09_12840 [Mesorhizobium qingshengii]|uniref:Uncharacterized protein n=1 Tax=Mesorhizobium qingshengii TaxID=1165689 RepID=A0ABT4QU47_9HYPH|nr:hypothetical protein [Mesorhizobium qingshengii]MCZ8545073.1 hypothetical protein [Mesorhizobium qingshengii]
MADAEIDKAMIVNWALVELGLAPKFSIDDETALGGFVDIFWPRALARSFGLHDWTFCRQTFQLTRQEATPVTGYRYGFDLPGNRVGPALKLLSDPRQSTPIRDFTIEGKTVFCDEQQAYARCKVMVDPVDWEPQFADAFATLLASYLAIPLTQDAELAADKEAKAIGSPSTGGTGGIFGRMIAQDRAAAPVSDPAVSRALDGGRTGGGDWFGRW